MVKPECESLDYQLQEARSELAVAQQDFLSAPRNSPLKGQAKKEVLRLLDLVQSLERSLRDCEGLPPYPRPVRALFTCTLTFSTSTPVLPSSVTATIPASMVFSDIDHRLVEFTFPATPVARVLGGVGPLTATNVISARTVSTVTGAFERSTGHIDMASALFDVSQSIDTLDNGTAEFKPLTTRTAMSPSAPGGMLMGLPLDRSVAPGRVILVGSTVLSSRGCFNGTAVDVSIDGVLSAFPPP